MADGIEIAPGIAIDPGDIEESFIRASGPGGQNVNKVSSAVQLRFDLAQARGLPEAVKTRVAALAGTRLGKDGVITITAARFRSQPQNREDALARLVALLQRGLAVPRPRRPTRPTLASKQRRLAAKGRRSRIKQLRGGAPGED